MRPTADNDSREDQETIPSQPPHPAGRTAAAGREFLRALVADLAEWSRRAKTAAVSRFRRRMAAPTPRPSGGRRFVRTVPTALAGFVAVASVALAAAMLWALQDVQLGEARLADAEPTILLQAADGSPLGRIGPLRIADAPLEDYPKHLVDAVLSVEDRRFRSHWGIDPRGIFRAFRRNLAAGSIVEGGSTITQQLVKMQTLGNERTYRRKLREALAAIWLERRLSKDEILTRYLNSVYLGANAHGMPAAARLYFDKQLSELTLAESALLAGLIQAPSQYSPLRDLKAARRRASTVLRVMAATGAIDREAAEEAIGEEIVLNRPQTASEAESWFAAWAADEAASLAGPFRGVLTVRTTLVPELQQLAEEVVQRTLAERGRELGISQAAFVAMRPDGAVVAMVGGRDYRESKFNRAVQALRQPGSAFKLFVYLAALRNGYDLGDLIEDAPIEIDGWRPENFGGRYAGRVTLLEAFARSINTVAVRLALDVGIDEVIAAARDLGIDTPLTETPSLALGASETSLLDLTAAYAAVLAGSAPVEPWGVAAIGTGERTQFGTMRPPTEPQNSLEPYRAPLLELLTAAVERGTARQAALGRFAAGKTGTSQNSRDAWFIGFDDTLVAGVWVGNDDGTPTNAVTGGKLPALMWKAFMTRAEPLMGASPGEELPEAAAETPLAGLFGRIEGQSAASCDYQACSRFYRSFRASDCTYQPYGGGPRRFCARGSIENVALPPVVEREREPATGTALRCDPGACSAKYSSFRASDCTYQPYGGGPRELCEIVLGTGVGPQPRVNETEIVTGALPERPATAPASCNLAACGAKYSSFRASDCTYQPYGGGPRELCTETSRPAARPLSALVRPPVPAEPEEEPAFPASACNRSACAAYPSFRASDCSYQPPNAEGRLTCTQ